MTDIHDKRRLFQKVKGMTNEQFERLMTNIFVEYYNVAANHFREAMEIELTPKQRERVVAKVQEIRELWDGLY